MTGLLRGGLSQTFLPQRKGSASQEKVLSNTDSITCPAGSWNYIHRAEALLSILREPVWAIFSLVSGWRGSRGCTGLSLLVIIVTRSAFQLLMPRECAGLRAACVTGHFLIWNILAQETPTLGSSYTYFSLICADASVGCASTVGSGSRGRDGGFVSWDVPPTPSNKTNSLNSQFHGSRRNQYFHCQVSRKKPIFSETSGTVAYLGSCEGRP